MADMINVPPPTREVGQRSISIADAYLTRFIPQWVSPSGLTAEQWRAWARRQPIASDCKDILIAALQSLDWKISPRDSDMRDELRATIRYYTKLLEQGGYWLGMDWTGFLEWLMNDLMDLPFGAGAEVGRKGDAPEGRVQWVKPLDGGTLYPTQNKNYPVAQRLGVATVNFPAHAIARMYMNPRPEIEREGWGMAPPERVYLALEMLARGDAYYANLLLDVPPAGILDLGDMEKDTALEWINSFRTFVANGGVDGFKIPVLYEHTTDPKFIPFGQVPNNIMFDRITLKYAALVTAAYGMTLGDIGIEATGGGGETLAGSIRSERRTRKTGLARAKKKLKFFLESILPDSVQFDFVDMDDELATALGRARLANATAWGQLIDKGVFDRKEARLQTIQDGLITISVPEDPPTKNDWQAEKKPVERPGMLGNPQAPSQGGDGEVKLSAIRVAKSRGFSPKIKKLARRICEDISPIMYGAMESYSEDNVYLLRSAVDESLYGEEDVFNIGEILKSVFVNDAWSIEIGEDLDREIKNWLGDDVDTVPIIAQLKHRVSEGLKELIGKSLVNALKETIISKDGFDTYAKPDYDSIVETMRKGVVDNFENYVATCLEIETNNIINQE